MWQLDDIPSISTTTKMKIANSFLSWDIVLWLLTLLQRDRMRNFNSYDSHGGGTKDRADPS